MFWRVRYAGRTEGAFDLYPFKFEFLHSDYVFPVFSLGPHGWGRYSCGISCPKRPQGRSGEFGTLIGLTWLNTKSTGPQIGGGIQRNPLYYHWGRWIERVHQGRKESVWICSIRLYPAHSGERILPAFPFPSGLGHSTWQRNTTWRNSPNTGDILRQNSYPFGVLVNHPTGKIKLPFRLWKDGPTVVDLGQGLDNKPPTMEWFKPAEIGLGSSEYLSGLKQELRMSMGIPPVAVGEDEGSQRSSLTLITRMFPIKNDVTTERWMWGPPMDELNRMALRWLRSKRLPV